MLCLGQSTFSHTSGKTHLDPTIAQPVTEDSILTLASCTKLITTIAALRLVEQGKLDLDHPTIVQNHLPELYRQPILISRGGPPFTYEVRKYPITVRHLLTHTSGSSFDLINPELQAWRASRGEKAMSLTAGLPEALEMPSLFQPGEGWTYGGGHDWVGLLIARMTGQTLGTFMREQIFDVVGCDARIGFNRCTMQNHGTIVQTVSNTPDGRLTSHPTPDQKSERGGGGLFSSARNFMLILGDLIALESKLLGNTMRDTLFAPQLKDNIKALEGLRASTPVFSAMTGPLTEGLKASGLDHALGGVLVVGDSEMLGKTEGTMTWGGAFSCMWFVNRERGVAGFYGSSVMMTPGKGVSRELMGEFVGEVWRKVDRAE